MLTLSILFGNKVHAATLTVVDGNDAVNNDSQCNLSEAIQNINDGAQTNNDCMATGDAYGTNDTINLPTGTITLTANLQPITQPITIIGQGMGRSTVDGDSQWTSILSASDIVASGMTITGTEDFGIFSSAGNVDLDQIEIDGQNWAISDINSGFAGGIIVGNGGAADVVVNLADIYIHNFDLNVAQFYGMGAAAGTSAYDISYSAENVTIENITNIQQVGGVLLGAGMFDNGVNVGTIDASISNITIADIASSSSSASGFVVAQLSQNDNYIDVVLQNSTMSNISGGGSNPILGSNGAAVGMSGAANGSTIEMNLDLTNVVLDAQDNDSCGIGDFSSQIGFSGGTLNFYLTSQGGNLSDDNSCSSYFTQPTDQNHVTGLASTLGTLGDYGGYVPTIPLLEGSPAIDAGVTVAGLTTDARGISRPLGLAYDSGAYESPFTKPTSTEALANTGQNIKLFSFFATSLLSIGFALQLRRHYV